MQEADAETIGISLSRSCQLSDQCPTIKELADEYDNSNQFYSGFFANSTDGTYERQPSPYKNSWEFYRYSNALWIIVDPHGAWIPRLSKHIIVEPSEFIFFDKSAGDFDVKPRYETITKTRQKQICVDYESPLCWETITYTQTIKLEPTRTERNNMAINSCSRATVHYSALNDAINHLIFNCNS